MGFNAKKTGRVFEENRCSVNFLIFGISLLVIRGIIISLSTIFGMQASVAEFFGNLLFVIALCPATYHITALLQVHFLNLEKNVNHMLFVFERISYVFYATVAIIGQVVFAILFGGCRFSPTCYLEGGFMLGWASVASIAGYLLFMEIVNRTMVIYDKEISEALYRRYKAKVAGIDKHEDIEGLLEIVYCYASFSPREFPDGVKRINKQFVEEYQYHSKREKRDDLAKVKAYSRKIVENFENLELGELAVDRKKMGKKKYGDLTGKKNIPELIAKYCSVGTAMLGLLYLILEIPKHLDELSKLFGV